MDEVFNAMTKDEKMKMKVEFQKEKNSASHPTPLSAAKTADVRLKRIHKEVCLCNNATSKLKLLTTFYSYNF